MSGTMGRERVAGSLALTPHAYGCMGVVACQGWGNRQYAQAVLPLSPSHGRNEDTMLSICEICACACLGRSKAASDINPC